MNKINWIDKSITALLFHISKYIRSDEKYIKLVYWFCFHKKLNLDTPQTFSEKLQWLKLNCKNEKYTELVDKASVKKYVCRLIDEKHIIPTLGVWNKFNDIDFNRLPNQFVLKCTHNSGGLVICKDKSCLNFDKTRYQINRCLRSNYFWGSREYPYKEVNPKIIAEKFMVDESGKELKDYKFYCFNGIPKLLLIVSGRGIDTRFDFFDMDFNHLDIQKSHPNAITKLAKPACFSEMITICEKLSENIPFVRVDLYNINETPYFGELTFFPGSGNEPWNPEEWDYKLGNWLVLPKQ